LRQFQIHLPLNPHLLLPAQVQAHQVALLVLEVQDRQDLVEQEN
jgi:hypothetical protein